jgi:hypothetical protein
MKESRPGIDGAKSAENGEVGHVSDLGGGALAAEDGMMWVVAF